MLILPFLSALQLTDSSFPSGLYTLSHGLEGYLQAGQLSAQTVEPLLADYLRYGVGPADGAALACAHRGASCGNLELVQKADNRLTAVKLAREARESSLRTGRQLLGLANQVFGGEALGAYETLVRSSKAQGNHAVVLGLVFATQNVPPLQALVAELYSFCASCVSAALRLAVLDYRQAQHIVYRLKPVIAEVASENVAKEVWEIGGCLPLAEVMAMRHEYAEVRLFIS